MLTKEQFYKSKQWEAFRKVIIEQRTDQNGYVHCCECGKPIINKYDLIIHHKQELSEANVNDAMISLNPDNVECICFRCHNKVHERFGYHKEGQSNYKPVPKRVYIVYGSPCAGKSTFVNEVATEDDLIVDLDSIWQMISVNPRYTKPTALKVPVFEIRDKLYDIIKYRSGKWHNAYIITGGAMKGDRDRLKQRVSADEFVFIDKTFDECIQQLKKRSFAANNIEQKDCVEQLNQKNVEDQQEKWIEYIKDWFEKFQPDD